jgi:hypothetical protein
MESLRNHEGLSLCQSKCLEVGGCNVVNFCDDKDTYCPATGRCCLRRCHGDGLKLVTSEGGWDVYQRKGGCWMKTLQGPGCVWSKKCLSPSGEGRCTENEDRRQDFLASSTPEPYPITEGTETAAGEWSGR